MTNQEELQAEFDKHKPRESHPLKKMEVGDLATMEKRLQGYVHVYGAQAGKKFSTVTSSGRLIVKRIA